MKTNKILHLCVTDGDGVIKYEVHDKFSHQIGRFTNIRKLLDRHLQLFVQQCNKGDTVCLSLIVKSEFVQSELNLF